MIRPVPLRYETGLGAFVEAPLLEADRERVHGLGRLLRGERCEHRRVDAAREQHADRHVCEQMRAHGVAQPGAEALRSSSASSSPRSSSTGTGPGRASRSISTPLSVQRSRWPAGSLRVSRKIEYGAGIELKARNASSASRSISPRGSARSSDANSSTPARRVVERLDPVAIAREHETRAPSRPRSRPRTSRGAAARTPGRRARRGGDGLRCRSASGRCGRRARARGAARDSCRSPRSARRRTIRLRSSSAGRRRRGR